MIIKIDVDDGVTKTNAIRAAHAMICLGSKNLIISELNLHAKITQHSRAGNIFINVSKTEGEALK